MARLHNMPCRIHPCLSYLDFREGNCLGHQKSGKTWNFMYKTYGELSTTCHHFEYRPLEIARFQRAVTSLFFAWFCSNVHWLFSIMNTLYKSKLDMWVLVCFNIIQRWLIVTSLQRGRFTDPGHINVVLREIPWEDKFSFLNVKSRHIFHVWKARRTMVIKGRDREWLLKQQLLLRAASERCDNVGRTLRRAV